MKRIIIGIKGKAGVGKDTVGNYLVKNYQFQRFSFAQPLKEIVSILTGWSLPYLEGADPKLREQRETIIHPDYNMTGRELLQYVGTELFRNQLNPDIWLNIAEQRILDSEWPRVVITDVRFPNEGEMIEKLGGHLIEIQSNKLGESNNNGNSNNINNGKLHTSESGFYSSNSYYLENNGSLEELYEKVDNLMKKLL